MAQGKKDDGTKRVEVLTREPTITQLIGWIADGKANGDLLDLIEGASGYRPTPRAVRAFRTKHHDAIQALKNQVVERVVDLNIKDREERIRRLSQRYDRLGELLDANDGQTTDIVNVGGRAVMRKRIDVAAFRELRGHLEDVRNELGDYNEPPERGPQINILQLVGGDGEARASLQRALAGLFLSGDDAGVVGGIREP